MIGKLLLPDIAPSWDGRFSENLWRWVRKHKNRDLIVAYSRISCYDGSDLGEYAYDKQPHNIAIGCGDIDDGWLHGSRLSTIISQGTKADIYAFPPHNHWVLVPDWFERYVKMGKCLIDPGHVFYPERWEYDGDQRTCRWCKTFRERRHVEWMPHVHWLPMETSEHAPQTRTEEITSLPLLA